MKYRIEDFRLAVEKCNNAELLKNLLIELVENSGICDGRSMPSITELNIEINEEDDLLDYNIK